MTTLHAIHNAPKDGTIIHICNIDKNVGMYAFWNDKTEQWEGEVHGVIGVVKTRWDKESDIQPQYWRNI